MSIIVMGSIIVLLGFSFIRFSRLVTALKIYDQELWQTLACPPSMGFSKTLGVFSWVLHYNFDTAAHEEIRNLGKQAVKRALIAKYSILSGLLLIVIGFAFALLNV